MKNVIVIHEKDLSDGEEIVIGVCSSIEGADRLIKEYYGDFTEISFTDIRDSDLEYSKVIQAYSYDDTINRFEILLQLFTIDSL
jgi:hypothetical protein